MLINRAHCELSICIALFSRLTVPFYGLRIILRDTLTKFITKTNHAMSFCISLICCLAVQLQSFRKILWDTFTKIIPIAQVALSLSIALFNRLTSPLHGLSIILRHTLTIPITKTKFALSSCIALLSRLTIPFHSLRKILLFIILNSFFCHLLRCQSLFRNFCRIWAQKVTAYKLPSQKNAQTQQQHATQPQQIWTDFPPGCLPGRFRFRLLHYICHNVCIILILLLFPTSYQLLESIQCALSALRSCMAACTAFAMRGESKLTSRLSSFRSTASGGVFPVSRK